MRGCALLVLGFVLGIGVMAAVWPQVPSMQTSTGAPDVRIQLSDAYLSRVVAWNARTLHTVSLQNITVASDPPSVLVLRASMSIGPLGVPILMEVQPYAVRGAPMVRVIQAQLAGVPVPGLVTGIVTRSINSSLHGSLPARMHMQAITVTAGGVEIVAR